jgi:organic radical activating enzyme
MRNNQAAEKPLRHSGEVLEVHSIFHTLQGEGPYAGVPAVFLRLAGCNLQCPDCDTDYTAGREPMHLDAILLRIDGVALPFPMTRLVVITGGEPMRQPLGPLIRQLLRHGWEVQLETNGTLFQEGIPYEGITVVCSPKTGSINKALAPHLSALKYVVNKAALGADGLPDTALNHGTSLLARPPQDFAGTVYLQPFDSGNAEENRVHQLATVEACLQTGATYCHQLHKLLELE